LLSQLACHDRAICQSVVFEEISSGGDGSAERRAGMQRPAPYGFSHAGLRVITKGEAALARAVQADRGHWRACVDTGTPIANNSIMTTRHHQIYCCMLLCVACGIVDAIGFLRHGIFAANMTGNTVLLGISLAQLNWASALARATPLVVFFVGAMLSRVLLTRTGGRAWIPLLLEASLLVAALALLPDSKWSLSLITFAMGVQSTAITQFDGVSLSTVVVTSTMARIAEAFADPLRWRRGPQPAAPAPLRLYQITWACYLTGAVLAGLGGAQSLAAMVGAAVLVLAAAVLTRRRW
jgi:uncharacterized membrane protein YoaK (UPF0700 family)